MALPKVKYHTFNITIPSTKKKVKFRPFVVGEEKILLVGQQSGDSKDMYEAVKQVINNCAIEEIDLDALAPFDLDYIFIKLRAQSVSNVVEVKYLDPEDEQEYSIKIDLNDVEVTFPETAADPIIQIDETIKVKLRYPTIATMDEVMESFGDKAPDASELADLLIIKSIDMIIDGEELYPASEASIEELRTFVDSIPSEPYSKVKGFFDAAPSIRHVVEYTNSKGTKRSIELNGLNDFFTF